jgi:hypothetical protein
MFDVQVEYPMPVIMDDKIVCVDVSVTLEIEPTDQGDTDWYIAGVQIWGRKLHQDKVIDPNHKDHSVSRKDPLFREISKWAAVHAKFAIEEQWDRWVESRSERAADAARAMR